MRSTPHYSNILVYFPLPRWADDPESTCIFVRLRGKPVSTGVNVKQTFSYWYILSLASFLSDTTRSLRVGTGHLTCPVSITPPWNVREMVSAERLPFKLTHHLFLSHTRTHVRSLRDFNFLKNNSRLFLQSSWRFIGSEMSQSVHTAAR